MSENMELMYDSLKVSRAMSKYGGDFVKRLGDALLHADPNNTQKIKDTFSEYWDKYLEIYVTKMKDEFEVD